MDATHRHLLIERLGTLLAERRLLLGTAESCTGGLIAAACTDVSGSSAWFAGGIVAYANAVKENVLRVPRSILDTHGAVSEQTVRAMTQGACAVLGTDMAIAVSGVAGPTGGSPEKPVGTVWLAATLRGTIITQRHHFSGPRHAVREQTVLASIPMLLDLLESAYR
ncbi:CinA family protein [Desulfovibrio psychrotolerans]|uniref:CinA C-terminal domain-containing protein n=1 Tax=Desulfovibrio psychrotolerans TaxID=415242 RepID=A0A7J0BX00_9BACT|nr:CinA family protein [Desulfovibrio psychrotolerans]GFM38240.1 hypothetical protein DSM19430T_29240 [Desulfovibrio psychrotolerans]